eukprot:7381478-Prymnesium_polylepis.2
MGAPRPERQKQKGSPGWKGEGAGRGGRMGRVTRGKGSFPTSVVRGHGHVTTGDGTVTPAA